MLNYLTVKKFCSESGYTEKAIYEKIRQKIWKENEQWTQAPDGRKLIIVNGYERWVEMAMASNQHQKVASKSRSSIVAYDAGKELSLSPPPLI